MPDFQEWVKATSAPNRRCKVCALPAEIYAQVVAARESGYGTVTISKFLKDIGYEVTSSSLENHFSKGGGHGR